ncbi:MAG TPA: helix-turn-helix domain-containing protein [Bellilinea sp.]|nr:helix-turn-helix domain-containing protein [Bellilinea sp.]
MAKRKFRLTPAELADITGVLDTAGSDPAYDRLRAILAYSSGVPWPELAKQFHCSRAGLQHYCSTYRRFGKDVLIQRRRRGGRDSRLTHRQLADLARRLATTTPAQAFPGIETFGGDHWTAKDLYRAILQWYGIVYSSPTTYYSLLKRLLPNVKPAAGKE